MMDWLIKCFGIVVILGTAYIVYYLLFSTIFRSYP